MQLNSTARFDVWGDGESALPAQPLGQVVLGGRRVTLADLAKVAALAQTVSCDPLSLAAMAANAAGVGSSRVKSAFAPSADARAPLPEMACRAVLFAVLASLLHGQSGVRPEAAVLLARMLSSKVIPALTGSARLGAELAGAMAGEQMVCFTVAGMQPSKQGLAAARLKSLTLTEYEVQAIGGASFFSAGVAGLVTVGASQLCPALDCIAALSCEAAGAHTVHFDAALFEVVRQQRGQTSSASNLRTLLEGSRRVNTAAAPNRCFAVVPQLNGPAADTIAGAVRVLETELNAYASEGTEMHDAQALLALSSVAGALAVLEEGSLDRLAALTGAAAAPSIAPAVYCEESRALSMLSRLAEALQSELAAALSLLTASGGDSSNDGAEEEDTAASRSGAEAAQRKQAQEEAGYTPEQRAKAEAKRRLKADKAAEKSKAKAAKKSSGTQLVLGVGTAALRAALAGASVVSPFHVAEGSVVAGCVAALERLSSGGQRRPKIPKGARDFGPDQMRVREEVFGVIRRVFKRHGGVEIDTPVFELKEVLTGKYGEDSKLIYDLADQGGELLSLRYDLTVPFARFLAMSSVGHIKRFHMAKVYRRDNPQLAKGRYREFYQCDFDIAGSYTPMVPDAEVITVAAEILTELKVGSFLIKLNHRKLLDAIFEISGVPSDKFRPICSAVDKLDKSPWAEVRKEMIEEKGLAAEVADRIGEFVLHSGEPKTLWEQLESRRVFGDHVAAGAAMQDLATLFVYLEAMGSLDRVSFDLSLARGLDYYTGVIYEIVLTDGSSQVGSIAAGGRYDSLVGMFSASGQQTPCVGVSIGVERVFTIIERLMAEDNSPKTSTTQVFIASIGAGFTAERMKVARLLWSANMSAEYSHLENPKFKKQLDEALERRIPFMIVFGEDEVARGVVKVKDMRTHEEVELALEGVVAHLAALGCAQVQAMSSLSI